MLKRMIVFAFMVYLALSLPLMAKSAFKHFVTVQNAKLMEGDKELYFTSINIPNLLLIEDNMPFEEKNPWRLPNEYEIRDALLSIKQMGGKVARTYVITVKRKDDLPGTEKHVTAPGVLNERAFLVMDTVLAVANELGVRLIIPLLDNWKWMGGRAQYAAFRGKKADEFWTDKQLKKDFKMTIAQILNRKNSVTGTAYKDDRAIMIWELGNELRNCPISWINEMAAFIKSIDQNHLINDGIQSHNLSLEIINDPYIDVLSTHHYEGDPQQMIDHIKENLLNIRGKKPYYIGEFGMISTQGMRAVLDEIRSHENVCGALLWSLRFHNRDGGFYWHSEPFGARLYKAYHWPGFPSGVAYDEQGVFALLTEINGVSQDSLPLPVLLPIKDVAHISWRGATGASNYLLQRSESKNGYWQNISGMINDASQAYTALYNDATATAGQTYFYRVMAFFPNGRRTVSEVVGPVVVKNKWLVDDCNNYGQLFQYQGKLTVKRGEDRSFKEDLSRLRGVKGAEAVYRVPGQILMARIMAFQKKSAPLLSLVISTDGRSFQKVKPQLQNFTIDQSDYNYWQPLLYEVEIGQKNINFLKIIFTGEVQIGRVEIKYRVGTNNSF